ncbi:MAG: hypothetical protein GY940_12200 [bacterium]|nr:hypothetical protein [bacterium]
MNNSRLPLTLNQQSIWYEQKLYPGSPLYNTGGYIRVKGPVQLEPFNEAVGSVIAKNDALRLIFHEIDGKPFQQFLEPQAFDDCAEFKDFSGQPDPHHSCVQWMTEQFKNDFVPFKAPLFQVALLKAHDRFHYLFARCHHIIIDAWGISLLLKYIGETYNRLLAGQEPTHYHSFKDYALDQGVYTDSKYFNKDIQYWKETFSPPPAPLLPLLTPKSDAASDEAPIPNHREILVLERELCRRLEAFAAKHRTSLFYLFIAATYIYFSRVYGNEDMVIGFPLSNRKGKFQKETVGMFTGIMPLRIQRIRMNREASLEELLRYIALELKRNYRHQRLPINRINKNIRHTDLLHRQLHQVNLAYLKHDYDNQIGGHETLPLVSIPSGLQQIPLSLEICDFSGERDVSINMDYLIDYLDSDDVQRFATHLVSILETIPHHLHTPLKDIEIVTPEEKKRLLEEFNAADAAYPKGKTIHGLFEDQV